MPVAVKLAASCSRALRPCSQNKFVEFSSDFKVDFNLSDEYTVCQMHLKSEVSEDATVYQAIKVIVAVDAAGVLLGWRLFDHAAHLGGATFGIAWSYWGNAHIWQKRQPLLRWWHELRGTSVK